jgi:hypothetical protein
LYDLDHLLLTVLDLVLMINFRRICGVLVSFCINLLPDIHLLMGIIRSRFVSLLFRQPCYFDGSKLLELDWTELMEIKCFCSPVT